MKRIFGYFLILSVLILLAGCATTTPLMSAIERGNINAVKELLNKGADVNEKDSGGWTPLLGAAYWGNTEAAKLLIDKGADVNATNNRGWTPLLRAALMGNTEIAKLLIEKGANIDKALAAMEITAIDIEYPLHAAEAKAGIKFLERLKPKQEVASQPSQGISKEELKTIVQAAVEGAKTQKQESKSPSVQSDIDKPSFNTAEKIMGDNDLAVIIGIEGYQGIPKSDYSYDDANLVGDYAKAMGFKPRNIELLLEERATKSAIEKIIKTWLPNKAKPDSRVFIYYSGHGAPEPKTGDAYIVPFDGDPNYLSDTGYPLKSLYDSLGKLQVAEVTVVLDACFSGAGGRSVLAKGSRPLVMMADVSVLSSNMAVLSATQGTQISTSSTEKGHGVFTYYFLKALKDGKKRLQRFTNT
ncbi:MAG: ankyrin repeat domain-containing protein [Deltaproteobacteria bacterium]|nr:ankyrin repeat domain-containing protein [Deltaproteobacteria bacterium]